MHHCLKFILFGGQSQWLHGLRRRSMAARLLGLWVRIPPGAWMFVCCECFVLSGRGFWETLASRRKLSHICALFKAYSGEPVWKPTGDRLQRPHYLSWLDHERKIRSRRKRTDTGTHSFVNRTIQHWNQLPSDVLGILPCKAITFKKRVRKVKTELN